MKSNQIMRTLSVLFLTVLLLTGCGRKEAPQIVSDGSEKPEIVNLIYKFDIGLVQMNFSLKGNPSGVGYQIDRTELDPYCKCPGFWRRYQEHPPHPKLLEKPIDNLISVRTEGQTFLYRIRAYDNEGNFGPWSKIMRAKYVDPFE